MNRRRRDSSFVGSLTWRPVWALVWFLSISVGAGLAPVAGFAQGESGAPWHCAVSGDSRNCGDVVMPAIAAGVKKDGAAFYWHLGGYRAIYDFDEDYRQLHPKANISQYENEAWLDFIEHQIKPFGGTPVYLSIGNHETIPPKTRTDYLIEFADWLLAPPLAAQRLADDPSDHALRAYYHWIERGVDLISMDNGTDDQFDGAQLKWLQGLSIGLVGTPPSGLWRWGCTRPCQTAFPQAIA